MSKLRLGVITDLPVGQAEEMAAVRRAVMVHPQYVAARQAQRRRFELELGNDFSDSPVGRASHQRGTAEQELSAAPGG